MINPSSIVQRGPAVSSKRDFGEYEYEYARARGMSGHRERADRFLQRFSQGKRNAMAIPAHRGIPAEILATLYTTGSKLRHSEVQRELLEQNEGKRWRTDFRGSGSQLLRNKEDSRPYLRRENQRGEKGRRYAAVLPERFVPAKIIRRSFKNTLRKLSFAGGHG